VHNKSHRGRKSSHPKSDAKTAGTSKNLATPAVNAAQSANGGAAPKAHAASTKTQDQQQTKPVAPSAPKVASPRAQAPVATPVNGRKVEILTEPLPAVDSTQTIRALTPLELGDEQASRWFAIQLSLADQPFDPNHVPHLDIFDQFRLYSVAGMDQGKYMHSLRLGFFESEASAQAVAGYLKCFFDTPAVKRVSNAERERFAEQQKVVARKDIGATGLHAVIELSSPRPVPETTLADLAESSGQRVTDDKSLWSRLIAPLKR
jgi:hypothetical protein